MRTDGVDAGDPALLAERAAGRRQLVAVDDLGCTEALEIVGLLGPAGRGDDMPAGLGEQGDRDRTDAAGRARDHDRAVRGFQAVLLERQHAEHGGVARRADRHRFGGRQARRQRHQPVAFHPALLGVGTEMGLPRAPTV